MTMADAPKPADGLAITRVFDAPRERIWREWTTPEAFADWYGGPEFEVPVESVLMDLRAGGGWRATMLAGPDRREIQWEGEYVEVVEPERLVFTVTDRPDDPERDLVTVELTDLGDGRTEMQMTQTGGHLPPAGYERAKEGWGGFLDRMDERLAEAGQG
jgi:uncharacterized protein YndB with AHSA1/START domain